MTEREETRQLEPGGSPENTAEGGTSTSIVAHQPPPRVVGRLDTYRSRSRRWHQQVSVEQCPGCGHPHLHRAPLPSVDAVTKNAPCGAVYVVLLPPEGVTA
ncbi:hypothetical protein AB0N23_02495 [Streptomyces sp. NPDC052644]